MRRALLTLALVAAAAACAPADPAAHAEARWAQCDGLDALPELRIDACSAVIDHPGTPAARRAAAYIVRGSLRSNLGQHARAAADFGRALRIDRNNPQAYFERGLVHQSRGAHDSAVRDYDAALALDPTMQLAAERRREALDGRAQAYRAELDQVSAALASDPGNAGLLNNRCWIRVVNNDDLNSALADCDAALRIEPANAAILDSRGLVHFKRAEYEAAISDYEAALAIEPGQGHYLYGRGVARLRLGLTADGMADLAAAERAAPGVGQLYESYGVYP